MTILAVTGLQREQRLLRGPGVEVVAGGGDHVRLEATLDRLAAGMSGIISIGIAGGLAPEPRTGQWIVASAIVDGDEALPTDPAWLGRLAARLPGAVTGALLGVDAIVPTTSDKAALHRATGAIAVDMESHIAARTAQRHGLRFAAARVVCDPAEHTLPPAARVGMRSDGRTDPMAVLHAVFADPRQIPPLIRTAIDAERAFRALLRGHRLLGPGLLGADLGELPLDMV